MNNKVISYLFKNSFNTYRTSADTLMFSVDDSDRLIILVSFEKDLKKNEDDETRCIGLSELGAFQNRHIKDITISNYEYLGDRDDLVDAERLPPSICFYLFSFLRELLNYSKRSDKSSSTFIYEVVKEHNLSLNYGYGEGAECSSIYCNASPNYVFEIKLQDIYLGDINLFKSLIGTFPELPWLRPPGYYLDDYKKNVDIPDKKKLKLFDTNTKTRRIGYLKLLADFFEKQKKIPQNLINKVFEEFVMPSEDELMQYKNTKGMIKVSKTGISAKPYIELGKDIGILNYLNGYYKPGKDFKVYIQLKKESEYSQVFELSLLDKIFFGEQLLKHDFFYLTNLLELIFVCEATNYVELKNNFKDYTLKKLEEILKQSRDGDSVSKRAVNDISAVYKRIKSWDKPEVYLEHLLMPRLNWLLDLDLIDMDEGLNVSLTDEGLRLLANLCCWADINCERIVTPDSFLERFSLHVFDFVYRKETGSGKTNEEDEFRIKRKITECIDESFEYFRTLAPNRVTASQAINYTKFKLFLTKDFTVEFKDIRDFLESDEQDDFLVMFQRKYNDGYIQRKHQRRKQKDESN